MRRVVKIDPAFWRRADMVQALGQRDVAAVFRRLQMIGVSQRVIAAFTGQSQSEVSEILNGRRVVAYDVLARIADGLGVPRGLMGLGSDDGTVTVEAVPTLKPVLDTESGTWVVRVPVFLDSYGTAMSVCDALVAPPAPTAPPGGTDAAEARARVAAASEAIAKRWYLASVAVLRGLETRAARVSEQLLSQGRRPAPLVVR